MVPPLLRLRIEQLEDRRTPSIALVSVSSTGGLGSNASFDSSVSADGRYVAFSSFATNLVAGDSNAKEDVFVWDRRTGKITLVSTTADGTQANDQSYFPKMSANGRYVAFATYATNLVPGDINHVFDVFLVGTRGHHDHHGWWHRPCAHPLSRHVAALLGYESADDADPDGG